MRSIAQALTMEVSLLIRTYSAQQPLALNTPHCPAAFIELTTPLYVRY